MRWRNIKKRDRLPILSKNNAPLYLIAPISSRLKAFIVDSFMLLTPVLYIVFYLIYGSREVFAEHMAQGWIFILLPYFFMTSLFFYIKGQTPGYRAYDLILIDTRTRRLLSWSMLCLRFIFWLIACASIVLLFVPFFRKDRLGIYDLVSFSAPVLK